MKEKVCVFLSMEDLSGYVFDDDLLHGPLQEAGWKVVSLPWRAQVDWSAYEAVIIRTTWDYQKYPEEYIRVLEAIEASGTPLANASRVVRWNFDKRYLFELEAKGVEIVPAILVEAPLTAAKLADAAEKHGASGIVAKPTVGATASETWRLSGAEIENPPADLLATYSGKPCLVQPFIQSVVDHGEYSLHFFGGEFSHAILKSPASGDYRVQEEWGGIPRPIFPETNLLTAAQKVMAALPEPGLYARIDLVRTAHDTFAVMEAELIEPALYFRTDPSSPGKFVKAFLEWVSSEAVGR